MNSSIKKGAIISYIAIFLNVAITFFYTPWMIRQIGVSDYGLYNLIISFISYFLMDFGLHQAVQRFIAKYRAENDEDKVSKMVAITTKAYLLIDAAIFLILFVLYFFISNIFTGLTPEEIEKLKVLYLIAGTFSVLNFVFKPMAGAMMAYEYFVEERTLEMVNKVGLVLIVCIALYLGAGVNSLVLVNGAVSLFVSIAKYSVFKYKSKLKIQWGYYDKGELKNIFSFSAWTFTISLAQRLRVTLIPAILGIVSNSQEIAIFSLALSIEGMIITISGALNGLFLPKVTRMAIDGNREQILSLMIRVGRLQLYVWGLIFMGFIVFGTAFLELWVGKDFLNSYYAIIFIAVPNLVAQTQSVAMDLVYADNEIKHTAEMTFITAVIGIIVTFPLAKYWGAVGASVGCGFGLCLYQLLLNIFYKKKLKLSVGRFYRECHGKLMSSQVVLCIAFCLSLKIFRVNSWGGLIIGIAVYTMFYMIMSYYWLFNKEEKNHIESLNIFKRI